jgi:hypothetical protein
MSGQSRCQSWLIWEDRPVGENIGRRHRNVRGLRYTGGVTERPLAGSIARLEQPQGCSAQKGELDMNKGLLAIAQNIVNAVWRFIRGGQAQPAPPPKVKLDGRRGYGDSEIPPHERGSDEK